jgi:PHP family Zn ribbon phosphoesterase
MELRYDLHIHSCLSPCGDNEMTPNNIIGMAQILELDVIAVSDHNTALNLPAICKLGAEHGILVVPAIEVTTAEEVHVLSLFPTLDAALDMGALLYEKLPEFSNDPEIFGEQLILDETDQKIGMLDKLLIHATALNIETVFEQVRKRGGLPIPAHIDKSSNSVLSNLGFLPPELSASVVEVAHPPCTAAKGLRVITDSDAHALESFSMHQADTMIVESCSPAGVIRALQKDG